MKLNIEIQGNSRWRIVCPIGTCKILVTWYKVNERKYYDTQHDDVCCSLKIFTYSINQPPQPQVKIDF
jgi:hypothetical protein